MGTGGSLLPSSPELSKAVAGRRVFRFVAFSLYRFKQRPFARTCFARARFGVCACFRLRFARARFGFRLRFARACFGFRTRFRFPRALTRLQNRTVKS